MDTEILELASSPEGISLDEIMEMFGEEGFDIVDELEAEQLVWLDDAEGVVYATGANQSSGFEPAMSNYLGESKLRKVIRKVLKEFNQYANVDMERVEIYEKTLINKFIKDNGRKPNKEEAKKISKEAWDDVGSGV